MGAAAALVAKNVNHKVMDQLETYLLEEEKIFEGEIWKNITRSMMPFITYDLAHP